jgi:NAD(P)-dependent dehydrogenase (short-subunit alcohol dehydrogenase family)
VLTKIYVIPGTAGVGKECLLALAKHKPAQLFFTGRNDAAGAEIVSAIKKIDSNVEATFIKCDFTSLSSIKGALSSFKPDRLDVVVASAGIMAVPAGLTEDGYEIQFGVNHIAHAACMRFFLPIMLKTAEQPGADVRFVGLTSQGYKGHPRPEGIIFQDLKTTQTNLLLGTWARYSQSKLANVLFAKELGRRYPQILSVPIHPGVVQTGLVSNLDFLSKMLVYVTNPTRMTPEEGAHNSVWTATSDRSKITPGQYYEPVGVAKSEGKCAQDEVLAKKLWEWTEAELNGVGF